MKKLLHRKGNKLFSYRIWEDDKEITNDWKRRKEIEDEALEELTKPHLPGDKRMQYNKLKEKNHGTTTKYISNKV